MSTPPFADRQLVYFIYGPNGIYLREAKLSILSVFRETATARRPRILVLTDRPQDLSGWPVDVLYVDQDTLNDWSGPMGYTHRRKAFAIRCAQSFARQSIFVDTDTFFLRSADGLFKRLEKNSWIVDEIEARWGDWRNDLIYRCTAQRLRDIYGIRDDMRLINSGVFGVRDDAIAFMDRTISLIDELYPLAPEIHIIEQFAAGAAGYRHPPPVEAKDIVTHYYGEKRYWHRLLNAFFESNGELFSEDLVTESRVFPRSKPKPPARKRLWFRIVTIGLKSSDKKLLRLLYFGANLPNKRYIRASTAAYFDHFMSSSGEGSDADILVRLMKLRPILFSSRYTAELRAQADALRRSASSP